MKLSLPAIASELQESFGERNSRADEYESYLN